MITRRETILGGALTLMTGGCACAQTRPARPHGFGCVLEPAQAEAFLATATEPQAVDGPETATLFTSSGNRAFDYALAQTLSRLTDLFGVLPGFAFYDDYDDPNAYWTNLTRMKRADGTVLFGKRYLQKYLAEPESPEVVITANNATTWRWRVAPVFAIIRPRHRPRSRIAEEFVAAFVKRVSTFLQSGEVTR